MFVGPSCVVVFRYGTLSANAAAEAASDRQRHGWLLREARTVSDAVPATAPLVVWRASGCLPPRKAANSYRPLPPPASEAVPAGVSRR